MKLTKIEIPPNLRETDRCLNCIYIRVYSEGDLQPCGLFSQVNVNVNHEVCDKHKREV